MFNCICVFMIVLVKLLFLFSPFSCTFFEKLFFEFGKNNARTASPIVNAAIKDPTTDNYHRPWQANVNRNEKRRDCSMCLNPLFFNLHNIFIVFFI